VSKRGVLAVLAVIGMLAVQYLAVSNVETGVYVIAYSDFTYGELYSYLPLPRAIVKFVRPPLRLLTYPLPLLTASLSENPHGAIARAFRITLLPLRDPKRQHVALALLNAAFWSAFLFVSVKSYGWLRRTTPRARSLALAGGALFLTAILALAALRFWYPADIAPNFPKALP